MAVFDSALTRSDSVFRLPELFDAFSEDLEPPPRKRARLSNWFSISNDGEALHEWPNTKVFHHKDVGASGNNEHQEEHQEDDVQQFDSLCAFDENCVLSVTPQRPRALAIDSTDDVELGDFLSCTTSQQRSTCLRQRFSELARRHCLTPLVPCQASAFPSQQQIHTILNSFTDALSKS